MTNDKARGFTHRSLRFGYWSFIYLGSLEGRLIFGVIVGLIGTAKGVQNGLGDTTAADFADLAPDAIDDDHITAAEWHFAFVIEPVVKGCAHRQFVTDIRPLQNVAKLP
jgi:hypothetical protein